MTTQKYDYHCGKCGGLVPEPMKAYGYSGQFCHCPEPTPATGKIINTTSAPTTQTEEWWKKELWALNCLNYDNRTHGARELESFISNLLTQERTRLKEEIEAYQAGIGKIANELRKSGFTKTADLIEHDLKLLKKNPTVDNVLKD